MCTANLHCIGLIGLAAAWQDFAAAVGLLLLGLAIGTALRFRRMRHDQAAIAEGERELETGDVTHLTAGDVIVLLAHAGPRHLTLASGQTIATGRAAELLAAAKPRLVVLAACQSVDLARYLADRGVPAVIGLRTRESVWALEELLEELLVNLMSRVALEDAFAATLDACVRLPETSAPVLYVNTNAPRPFMLVPPDTGN